MTLLEAYQNPAGVSMLPCLFREKAAVKKPSMESCPDQCAQACRADPPDAECHDQKYDGVWEKARETEERAQERDVLRSGCLRIMHHSWPDKYSEIKRGRGRAQS